MPAGILFYMLLLIWVLFGLWGSWPRDTTAGPHVYVPAGGNLLLFLLILLLGWATFGAPLK